MYTINTGFGQAPRTHRGISADRTMYVALTAPMVRGGTGSFAAVWSAVVVFMVVSKCRVKCAQFKMEVTIGARTDTQHKTN